MTFEYSLYVHKNNVPIVFFSRPCFCISICLYFLLHLHIILLCALLIFITNGLKSHLESLWFHGSHAFISTVLNSCVYYKSLAVFNSVWFLFIGRTFWCLGTLCWKWMAFMLPFEPQHLLSQERMAVFGSLWLVLCARALQWEWNSVSCQTR